MLKPSKFKQIMLASTVGIFFASAHAAPSDDTKIAPPDAIRALPKSGYALAFADNNVLLVGGDRAGFHSLTFEPETQSTTWLPNAPIHHVITHDAYVMAATHETVYVSRPGKQVYTIRLEPGYGAIVALAVNRQNNRLGVLQKRKLTVWDVKNVSPQWSADLNTDAIALTSIDTDFAVLLRSGYMQRRHAGGLVWQQNAGNARLLVSNGNMLASADAGAVRLWNAAGTLLSAVKSNGTLYHLSFENNLLATAAQMSPVHLWRVTGAAGFEVLEPAGVFGSDERWHGPLAISPKGDRLVAASSYNKVLIWQLAAIFPSSPAGKKVDKPAPQKEATEKDATEKEAGNNTRSQHSSVAQAAQ